MSIFSYFLGAISGIGSKEISKDIVSNRPTNIGTGIVVSYLSSKIPKDKQDENRWLWGGIVGTILHELWGLSGWGTGEGNDDGEGSGYTTAPIDKNSTSSTQYIPESTTQTNGNEVTTGSNVEPIAKTEPEPFSDILERISYPNTILEKYLQKDEWGRTVYNYNYVLYKGLIFKLEPPYVINSPVQVMSGKEFMLDVMAITGKKRDYRNVIYLYFGENSGADEVYRMCVFLTGIKELYYNDSVCAFKTKNLFGNILNIELRQKFDELVLQNTAKIGRYPANLVNMPIGREVVSDTEWYYYVHRYREVIC